jgi:hypothetical protein
MSVLGRYAYICLSNWRIDWLDGSSQNGSCDPERHPPAEVTTLVFGFGIRQCYRGFDLW